MLVGTLHMCDCSVPPVMLCLLQVLSYMSIRGHPYGIITTYFTTWVVKSDGRGTLWVSPGIDYMTNGNNNSEVTVTKVRMLDLLVVLR